MSSEKIVKELDKANELYNNGKYSEAISIYEGCYKEDKENKGLRHLDTLNILYRLAECYFYIEDYEKSLELEKNVIN